MILEIEKNNIDYFRILDFFFLRNVESLFTSYVRLITFSFSPPVFLGQLKMEMKNLISNDFNSRRHQVLYTFLSSICYT